MSRNGRCIALMLTAFTVLPAALISCEEPRSSARNPANYTLYEVYPMVPSNWSIANTVQGYEWVRNDYRYLQTGKRLVRVDPATVDPERLKNAVWVPDDFDDRRKANPN